MNAANRSIRFVKPVRRTVQEQRSPFFLIIPSSTARFIITIPCAPGCGNSPSSIKASGSTSRTNVKPTRNGNHPTESFYSEGGLREFRFLPRREPGAAHRPTDLHGRRTRRHSGRSGYAIQQLVQREHPQLRQQHQHARRRHAPSGFRRALTRTLKAMRINPVFWKSQVRDLGRRFPGGSDSDHFGEGRRASVRRTDEDQTRQQRGHGRSIRPSPICWNPTEEHPREAKMIVDKVILAATARHAARKARELVQRERALSSTGLPANWPTVPETDASACG